MKIGSLGLVILGTLCALGALWSIGERRYLEMLMAVFASGLFVYEGARGLSPWWGE